MCDMLNHLHCIRSVTQNVASSTLPRYSASVSGSKFVDVKDARHVEMKKTKPRFQQIGEILMVFFTSTSPFSTINNLTSYPLSQIIRTTPLPFQELSRIPNDAKQYS